MNTLTYSAGTTFCDCQRLYYLKYEENLRRDFEDEGEALTVGKLFHLGREVYAKDGIEAALDVVRSAADSMPGLMDEVKRNLERCAKAAAMLRVSVQRWPEVGQLTEQVLSMQINNPYTTGQSRSFTFSGKLDSYQGGIIIDFKTVSDPVAYLEGKNIGYQMELYAMALSTTGEKPISTQFRLVARPSIKYCAKDADPRAFEERCVEWLVEKPNSVVEHEMFFTNGRIAEAQEWLWQVAKGILDCRRRGVWLRNQLACRRFGGCCEYMPICELEANGHDASTIIEEKYVKLESPHVELAA